MSGQREQPGADRPRQVSVDANHFLEAPIELLRETALARSRHSGACALMARMFRLVAYGLMFGGSGSGSRGTGYLPPGMTVKQAAQRAVDLLDLADEIDGLGRP